MIEALSHVNWLAVGIAIVAHFILGAAWFIGLIGKQYPIVLGIADRPQEKRGLLTLDGPFACTAVTIATSATLLRALGIATYGDALGLGVLVGVGYLIPMTLNIAINPLFPRPFAYTVLNAPFFVIASLMSCTILVAMS